MGRGLTEAEKIVIEGLWRQHPDATACDLARIARRPLGRPNLAGQSVGRLRPPDLPAPVRVAGDVARLSKAEVAAIRDLWREHPGATGPRVAEQATLRLGRPVSVPQAQRCRPAADPAPPEARRPARGANGSTYISPLDDMITEARRVRKRVLRPIVGRDAGGDSPR